MICKHKDKKHCLMYDKQFFMCTALNDMAGSQHCPFFKDVRELPSKEVNDYKAGCKNGFTRKFEEIRFSSFDSGRFK